MPSWIETSRREAPDVTGLIELSRDPQLDLKPVILRVQTDLFLAAPVRDRAVLAAFCALATGLIRTVDAATALTVARKLAPCPDTPPAVLASLAALGGPVCAAVLETAPELAPEVIAAAREAGFEVEEVVAVQEEEPELPGDLQAGDSHETVDPIAEARLDPERAATLLGQGDIAPADLAPLWLHAGKAQRQAIIEAVGATAALRPCPPAPNSLGNTLTGLSRAGHVPAFGKALADGLGIPETFLTAAPDPSARYDLLTLALRAANLSEAEAVFIFLTLSPTVARSVDRVYALVQLFRSLDRATARDLVGAVLGVSLPERVQQGRHEAYEAGVEPLRSRQAVATQRINPRAILPVRARRSV